MTGDEAPLPELRKAPAERAAAAVLPASGIAWAAAEAMHLTGFPGTGDLLVATAVSAAFAWGASGRWKSLPRTLPASVAAAGGWLALAAAEGPLAGWPYAPLTWTWAGASFLAWRWARRHPAVLEAQEWRLQRAEWLEGRSRRWGLGGSHLLGWRQTRLGEWFEADVRGTGKRASQVEASGIAELIAEHENLPPSRVQVRRGRLAGRVTISIRRTDPWASPVLHPVLDEAPEVHLPVPCSITDAPLVGIDPEAGRPLAVPLYDEAGGKCVTVVSLRGGGKTVLLDSLSERVTAASDALQVRVNLSVKGHAEAERWGPACHLTALGPQQKGRAVKVLQAVNRVIEWRAQRYTTGKFAPSPRDPLVVVVIDEADSAMAVPAVRAQVDDIATKGREFGVTLVRAGQRGTADYGSAKTRAQDDVFCIGKVNRQGEAYHAAGSMGFTLPDMASYGEGHAGVWAVAELGGGHQAGRTFKWEPEDAARIARERAFAQPELHPDCRAFLGESYELLLSTDVFAKWARKDRASTSPPPAPAPAGQAPAPSPSPVATLDDIDHLDFTLEIDDDTRAKLAAIDAKNAATRQLIEGTRNLPAPPEVSPEALAAHTAERWRQVGDAAQVPDEARPVLLRLLGEGTTASAVAEALGVSKWTARTYLERMRNEGIAYVDGVKRAARWRMAGPGQGGDAS